MNDIMVSICCLTYNHEKYIRKALDGFIMQKTNFKFEVLIHDDASTDGTADIIREYEAMYPDIIKPIYQMENQYSKKVNISRIYQYPRVKGKYIALCEGDDYWVCDTKLQEQIDILESHPDVILCTTKVRAVTDDEKDTDFTYPADDSKIKEGIIKRHDFMRMLMSYDKYPFQTTSYVLRADFLKKIKADEPDFMKYSPTGDTAVLWACALNGDAYYLDKEMSKYRRGVAGSWSSKNKNNDFVINHHIRLISAYKALNEYTNGKYEKLIKKNIRLTELNIMKLSGNSKSIKDKISLTIHKMKPTIYKYLKKYCKPILGLLRGGI